MLLIPGILLALITVHMGLLVKQKHTQFPGPGRTNDNVVGERMFPSYAAKAGGFFMLVFGVIAALGGLFQINPIWLFGPYNPAQVVSPARQPDWYIMFLDGSTRLMPAWEITALGTTRSRRCSGRRWCCPASCSRLPTLYPFIEARLTQGPARRTTCCSGRGTCRSGRRSGAMAIAFYIVLLISGGNDVIADKFDISLNAMTWAGRIGAARPAAAGLLRRPTGICLGLQQHDREVLAHGVETGIIKRLPDGEFIEVHQPLGPVDEHGHGELEYAGCAGAEEDEPARRSPRPEGDRLPRAGAGPGRGARPRHRGGRRPTRSGRAARPDAPRSPD